MAQSYTELLRQRIAAQGNVLNPVAAMGRGGGSERPVYPSTVDTNPPLAQGPNTASDQAAIELKKKIQMARLLASMNRSGNAPAPTPPGTYDAPGAQGPNTVAAQPSVVATQPAVATQPPPIDSLSGGDLVAALVNQYQGAPSGADAITNAAKEIATTNPVDTANQMAGTGLKILGTSLGAMTKIPFIGEPVGKALQYEYKWSTGRTGDDIYKVATGEMSPADWPLYHADISGGIPKLWYAEDAAARAWAIDPANKAKIKAIYETGLLGEDGKPIATGGQAVYLAYIAEEHPGVIDNFMLSLGADPLSALFFTGPAAKGVGAGVEQALELESKYANAMRSGGAISGLTRTEITLQAIARTMKAVERGGEIANAAADPTFIPRSVVEHGPAWLRRAVEAVAKPSNMTANRTILNTAADVADVAQAASDIPVYGTNPGGIKTNPFDVTDGNTGPQALPAGETPVDPVSGAPINVPLTDSPIIDRTIDGGPVAGGSVSDLVDGPIFAKPRPAEPVTPSRPVEPTVQLPATGTVIDPNAGRGATYGGEVIDQGAVEARQAAEQEAARIAEEQANFVPVSGSETSTVPRRIGLNGDVNVKQINPKNGVPQFELRIKKDPKKGWTTSNTIREVYDSWDTAIEQGKEYVRRGQVPDPAKTVSVVRPGFTQQPTRTLRTTGMTPAERNAAIKRGEISSLTPVPGGKRLVDQAWDRGATDPAGWQTFESIYAPKARAYLSRTDLINKSASAGGTYIPDFTQKRTMQVIGGIEHVVDDVAPTFIQAYGDLPDIGPTSKRVEPTRRVIKTGKRAGEVEEIKASYRDENLPYLYERYVYTKEAGDAERILEVLRSRNEIKNAPWANDELTRLQEARQRLMELRAGVTDPVTFAAKSEVRATMEARQAAGEVTDETTLGLRIANDTNVRSLADATRKADEYLAVNPTQERMSAMTRLKDYLSSVWKKFSQSVTDQNLYAVDPRLRQTIGEFPESTIFPEPGTVSPELTAESKQFYSATNEVDIQEFRGELPEGVASALKSTIRDFEIKRGGKWTQVTPEEFAKWADKKNIAIPASGSATYPFGRVQEMTQMDLLMKTAARNIGADATVVEQAFAHRIAELTGLPLTKYTAWAKPLEAVRRPTRHILRSGRSIVINNPLNIPKALSSDALSDGLRMAAEGHSGLDAMNLTEYIRRVQGKPRMVTKLAEQLGFDIPNELKVSKGRTDFETSQRTATHQAVDALFGSEEGSTRSKVTGIVTGVVDSRTGARGRAIFDDTRREAVFNSEIEKLLPRARQAMREEAMRFGTENGILPSSIDAYLDPLGGKFSATEVRNAMTELANDAGIPQPEAAVFGNHLSRYWQGKVNEIRNLANKEQKRVLFSYERTKLDEQLGHVFFFHYWMTRAVPAYLKIAIRDPQIAAAWMRLWQDVDRRAEADNQPPSLRGYIRVMGSLTGFYGSMNPWNIILPIADLRPEATANGTWEKVSQFLMVTPIVQEAAAVIGWTDQVPDPLGSYAPRGMAMAIVNKIRAERGQSPYLSDPWESLLRSGTEIANEIVSKANFPTSRRQTFIDPSSFARSEIRFVVASEISKQSGVPFDQWGDREWGLWEDAILDGESGIDNPTYLNAYQEWADAKLHGRELNVITPGGYRLRYGPRDQLLYADELNDGQKTFMDSLNAGNANAVTLTRQKQQLDDLGTEDGRWSYKMYNQIAYDDVPLGGYIELNGQRIMGSDLNAMTTGQRQELARQWIAQYVPVENLDIYTAARTAFLDKHPEVATFKEFESSVYRYDGGPKAWRVMYAKKDKAFAAKMKEQEDYWKSKGFTGAVLDEHLDQWAAGQGGYEAANGIQSSIYDAPTTPKVPDYGFDTGTGASSGSSTPKTPTQKLKDTLTAYEEKMTAAMAAMRAAGYSVTEEDLYNPNPYLSYDAYGVPTMNDDVFLYKQWAALNAGKDTSVDAYIAYLTKLGSK